MGFYREQVLPRFQDKLMDRKPFHEIRARVCAELAGEVVEIGFGTGLNTRYYPAAVTQVDAVEPSRVCKRIAEPRVARARVRVEPAGLTGEHLELPSAQCDAALSTWTLCTIPDVAAALDEVHRVLKRGGRFHFVEHGHAPDPDVARWQRRIEPAWKPLAGGCHLTRPMAELVENAGFSLEKLDTYYMEGEPRPFSYMYEGHAIKR